MKIRDLFKKLNGTNANLTKVQAYRVGMSLKQKFGEVETDRGTLIYDGELAEGKEVYLAKADEVPSVAPDDTYTSNTQRITVADGRITDIEELEAPEMMEDVPEASAEIQIISDDIKELLEEVVNKVEVLENNVEELTGEITMMKSQKNEEFKERLSSLEQKFEEATRPLCAPAENKPGVKQTGTYIAGKNSKFQEILNS